MQESSRRELGNAGEDKQEGEGEGCIEALEQQGVTVPALIAEFVSSFLFQFLASLCFSNAPDTGITTAALGSGASLAVAIYCSASISGGHINPAITVSLSLIGEAGMTMTKVLGYVCAQIGGAILGAGFAMVFTPDTAVYRNPFVAQGVLYDGLYRNLAAVGIFEFVMTFAMMYIVCSVALDGRCNASQYGPLAIGLTYTAGVYSGGPYTGASMNPARSIASALVFGDFTGVWVALLSIFLGGAAGAIVFKQAHGIKDSADHGAWI